MRFLRFLLFLLVMELGLLAAPWVAQALAEVEPNDSFATRQVLPAGITQVEGAIENIYSAPELVRSDSLAVGQVDSFLFTGLSAGQAFVAWIDNEPSGSSDFPDTVLGSFDPSGILLRFNDDGSPVGDTFASGLAGFVNADGTIRLKVSGFGDCDFDGFIESMQGGGCFEIPGDPFPHLQFGSYQLFVRLERPDVDYSTFQGLAPGASFVAEIVSAATTFVDSVLGRFDEAGALVALDDDGGTGGLSRLEGTVPATGRLHLAVSVYDDCDFDGAIDGTCAGSAANPGYFQFGSYTLRVTAAAATPSPSPSTTPTPTASPTPTPSPALDCECVVKRLRTPGGGIVARLKGPNDTMARTIGATVTAVGSQCPATTPVRVDITATDDGGGLVTGTPGALFFDCPLGGQGGTNQRLNVTYGTSNCDSGSVNGIEIVVQITGTGLRPSLERTTRTLLCQP